MRDIHNRFVHDTLRTFFGPKRTWDLPAYGRRLSRDLPARLHDAFRQVAHEVRCHDEQPVFVLSAGWRSGSTVLQRMIMENNEDIVIWGEPYDLCNIHDSLLNQFRAFSGEWPPKSYFLSNMASNDLSDSWVANLYPDVEHLVQAHRNYYRTLFAEPALRAGRKQWGLKEVRLTIEHAIYFRALYPRSKILLLYRNPLDAYRSYRRWNTGVFRTWPDRFISTPYAFGRNWAEITKGFLEGHNAVDGFLIRYEDLDDDAHVKRLADYLGWNVPRSSEMRRIRDRQPARATDMPHKTRVSIVDRVLLHFATGAVRKDAGYAST